MTNYKKNDGTPLSQETIDTLDVVRDNIIAWLERRGVDPDYSKMEALLMMSGNLL